MIGVKLYHYYTTYYLVRKVPSGVPQIHTFVNDPYTFSVAI